MTAYVSENAAAHLTQQAGEQLALPMPQAAGNAVAKASELLPVAASAAGLHCIKQGGASGPAPQKFLLVGQLRTFQGRMDAPHLICLV